MARWKVDKVRHLYIWIKVGLSIKMRGLDEEVVDIVFSRYRYYLLNFNSVLLPLHGSLISPPNIASVT